VDTTLSENTYQYIEEARFCRDLKIICYVVPRYDLALFLLGGSNSRKP
jgi:hypothetical protein